MLLLLEIYGMQFKNYILNDRIFPVFTLCINKLMSSNRCHFILKQIVPNLAGDGSMLWNYLDCPCGGVQYSKIEEVDRVYDFLPDLNSKFNVVQGRILEQRPIPPLMEVCYVVPLQEDRVGAINIKIVLVIDSIAFSAKLSGSNNDKQWTMVREHCKKPWHTKEQC